MSIFPNPASDQVAVEIINRGNEINDAALSVYDMSGQLVHSYAHINTQTTYFLNIRDFTSGNYILKLTDKGVTLGTTKLIKD
jgi:restriction endonuclease S subunit